MWNEKEEGPMLRRRKCATSLWTTRLAVAMVILGTAVNLSPAAAAAAASSSLSSSSFSFTPLTLTLSELQQEDFQAAVMEALQTTGMIAIRQDDADASSSSSVPLVTTTDREIALEQWCRCYKDNQDVTTTTTTMQNMGIPSTQVLHLKDGTKRTTLATATIGQDMPLALDEAVATVCGSDTAQALDDLRDYVQDVSQAFVQVLDRGLNRSKAESNNPPSSAALLHDTQHQSYSTISSIIQAATHLEHFHIYEKQQDDDPPHGSSSSSSSSSKNHDDHPMALDVHTDAGLFLTFVPGYDCDPHASQPSGAVDDARSSSFWIQQESKGESNEGDAASATDAAARGLLPVRFHPATTAVIMLGAGAEQWLWQGQPPLPLHLRATRHAVQLHAWQTRAWYGKMHLVPDQAIVQTVPTLKTFKDLKGNILTTSIALATGRQDDQTVQRLSSPSLGCGNGMDTPTLSSSSEPLQHGLEEISSSTDRRGRHRRRLQHVPGPSACNNATNFFCWYQCLSIPDASRIDEYVDDGYSLYCLDPAVLPSSGGQVAPAAEPCEQGFVHNAACQGSWQPTAPGVPTAADFSPRSAQGNHSVANLDQYCYGGVSMYMDGFHWVHDSICVIYLFPQWVLTSRSKLAVASVGTLFLGVLLEAIIWQRRRLLKRMAAGRGRLTVGSIFYGLQLTLGYILMLVIMTYSGILFLCSIFGLVAGNIVFNAQDGCLVSMANEKTSENSTSSPQDEYLPDKSTGFIGMSIDRSSIGNDQGIPEGVTPCCQHAAA